MPNIKSAKKRVKVNFKKNLRNKIFKSKLRTAVKKAMIKVKEINDDSVSKQLAVKEAIKFLDRAANKRILHKNNVARRKSSLSKLLVAS